jgi:hypothetical protein
MLKPEAMCRFTTPIAAQASQGCAAITLMWFHELNGGHFSPNPNQSVRGDCVALSSSCSRDVHCAEPAQSNNILFSVQRLLAARGSDTPAGHSCRNRVHAGDCQRTPGVTI